MRFEEVFVMEALVSKFGGVFTPVKDDPPVAYLLLNDQRIAVEVSMLVEQISENGVVRSRMAYDSPVTKISEELERDIGNSIPEGKSLYLGLPSPIKEIRKFKKELAEFALDVIKNNTESSERIILGSRVSINYRNFRLSSDKKVSQFVSASQSFHKEQAEFILKDRITVKNKKIGEQIDGNEYWLALLNTYWPANIETYRNIYANLQTEHNFSKILIIDNYKKVEVLY